MIKICQDKATLYFAKNINPDIKEFSVEEAEILFELLTENGTANITIDYHVPEEMEDNRDTITYEGFEIPNKKSVVGDFKTFYMAFRYYYSQYSYSLSFDIERNNLMSLKPYQEGTIEVTADEVIINNVSKDILYTDKLTYDVNLIYKY